MVVLSASGSATQGVVVIGSATSLPWGGGAPFGAALQIGPLGGILADNGGPTLLCLSGAYYNGTGYQFTGTGGGTSTGALLELASGGITVWAGGVGTYTQACTFTEIFQAQGTVAPTIKGYGPNAATLVDMTPDFWLGTATVALAANAFATATVARVGPVTTIWVPAVTGSGNGATTTMVVTVPMPAAFQNSGTLSFNLAIEAAGTSQMGLCNYSGTTFTMFPAITGGTFTGITNRGIVNGILMSWPNAQS